MLSAQAIAISLIFLLVSISKMVWEKKI